MCNVGCELVAIYNAIYLKEFKNISMAGLIKYSENHGYSMRNGAWGTTPYRIGKILTYYGLKYNLCKKKNKIKPRLGEKYIVSVYNEGGLFDGVHTFAVVGKRKGYIIYNDGQDLDKKYRTAKNRKKLLNHREYIIGYKIRG